MTKFIKFYYLNKSEVLFENSIKDNNRGKIFTPGPLYFSNFLNEDPDRSPC